MTEQIDVNALQQLLDKQAITDLICGFARAADRHDHEAMRSLYHEDAIDEHGGFFKGAAKDFIDRLPEMQAPMQILHHNMTTINIVVDHDYAEGESYVLAYHQVKTDDGLIDLIAGGRYLDKFEKRDGEWRFSHRSVIFDWVNVNQPTAVQLDHPMLEGSMTGTIGTEDPSFRFFKLFKFQS